jgi:hypothetical protein
MSHTLLSDSNGRGVTSVREMPRPKEPGGPQVGSVTAEILGAQRLFTPNRAMLSALARIEEIQRGMQPVKGNDSLNYLREARSGGMYGYSPDE